MNENIVIKNAHLNNLKNINLKLPKNKIIVFCGVSGSGKSTLIFDTIFKEGQKRYIESLSSYARQYLDFYSENKVDQITGLSPAISIDQKTRTLNPRSTVGTLTETTDRLRVLFSKIGKPNQDSSFIFFKKHEEISSFPAFKHLQSLSIFYKPTSKKVVTQLNSEKTLCLKNKKISKQKESEFYLLDSFKVSNSFEKRIQSNLELLSNFNIKEIILSDGNKIFHFKSEFKSKSLNIEIQKLTPSHFSYNSPKGACDECKGLGEISEIDPYKLFDNPNENILNGASTYLKSKNRKILNIILSSYLEDNQLPNQPVKNFSESEINKILHGDNKEINVTIELDQKRLSTKKKFKGLLNLIKNFNLSKNSLKENSYVEEMSKVSICNKCQGTRLSQHTKEILISGYSIGELTSLPLNTLNQVITKIKNNLSGNDKIIGQKILRDILDKLDFLNKIGLNYLTLNRSSKTLSGGESQRIRLANQIGSKLSGILYVLDEPSIGLHPSDNDKLIKAIKKLKQLNNTVLIVEHDEDTIKNADYIVEIGPDAGKNGGEILFNGSTELFKKSFQSETSNFIFRNQKKYKIKKSTISNQKFLSFTDIKENNLNKIDIKIPIGKITAITGPSGSGKSTLIHNVISPAIKENISNKANKIIYKKNNFKSICGLENIDQVIELTQAPLGRSPKSNPSTYLGIFDSIRNIFAKTNEAKTRGYAAGNFSFNVAKGRCEACDGNGVIKTEMQFLPDVTTKCNICLGQRFKKETLEIKFKGLSISDVLNLEVNEALNIFKNHKKIHKPLSVLNNLGLGYLSLGQPSTTLSGGEAQRVKLAKEISKSKRGHSIYLLDEPTTGLHFKDINKLLLSFEKLRDNNSTLVIIEHNRDIILNSDHIIDLGPSGGEEGGNVVFQGPTEKIKTSKQSLTGKYL